MAIQLALEYTKTIGLPAYSSHRFSVALNSEVADPDHIEQEVERVYRVLQESVDKQITESGFVPGNGQPSNGNGSGDTWACSDKQKSFLLRLVKEHNLDRNEVEALAKERFGHGIKQLNKLEMSGIIDELLEQHSKHNGRKAGSSR